MKVELLGRLTTFGKVERGALFQFAAGENEHLGMKVGSQDKDALVVFDPSNPQVKGRPILQHVNWSGNEPVFELTNAFIRRSLHPSDLRLSDSARCDCGDLVLAEDRVWMQVLRKNVGSDAFVDVATGEMVHLARYAALVKRWSMVQIVDGEPEILFRFPPNPA